MTFVLVTSSSFVRHKFVRKVIIGSRSDSLSLSTSTINLTQSTMRNKLLDYNQFTEEKSANTIVSENEDVYQKNRSISTQGSHADENAVETIGADVSRSLLFNMTPKMNKIFVKSESLRKSSRLRPRENMNCFI